MIPSKIFTSFAEFQGIVSVNDFRLPVRLQELLQAPLCFLWSFCFARIRLDPLSGQVLHHDCISVIVSRIAIVTENLVICCYQVTKIFCTKYGSAIASSAWGPCNFGPLTDLAISLFREVSFNIVFTTKSALLAGVGSKQTSWEELAWEPPCNGISSSTKFSLNSCSHSGISELARLESADNGLPRSIINIGNWHRHWRGIIFSSVLSFSSLIITWWCRWWRRRAWGRCRTRPLLSWRCLWSWMIRTGGRTRWQAWNDDRNEVLCVALYLNTVFNEMWFLTFGPFIRVSVFIVKLSERQYCWRVIEDFHSQENVQFFDIHCSPFMRLQFSIGGDDYRRTTRFRQGIHFSITQVLFADHVHRRSGVDNKFSFLRFKSWCRQAPIFRRWEERCSVFLL